LKRVHQCVAENRAAEYERIRIAILDSGIDARHTEMAANIVFDVPPSSSDERQKAIKEANTKRCIKACRGFPQSLDPLRDRVGHGTHCASVILRTAPYTSLYIARIFDDDKKISDPDQVVEVMLVVL
jgi:subtilisin family serine protease